MQGFLWGALAAGSLTAALFFARFWRDTADRLLLYFALAFAVLGVHWAALGVLTLDDETRPYIYAMRLSAFLLILVGIVEKNRRG